MKCRCGISSGPSLFAEVLSYDFGVTSQQCKSKVNLVAPVAVKLLITGGWENK